MFSNYKALIVSFISIAITMICILILFTSDIIDVDHFTNLGFSFHVIFLLEVPLAQRKKVIYAVNKHIS